MIHCTFENGNKASLRHVVVDNIVLKDNKILLVKRTGKILEGGKWGLPCGFMERGDTILSAIDREVFEETGWRVSDKTLLRIKDSPNRPHEDRQNVGFTFFCKADAKEGDKDWESDEVKWFELNALPPASEIAFDHFEDIELYKEYLKNKFTLPLSLQ